MWLMFWILNLIFLVASRVVYANNNEGTPGPPSDPSGGGLLPNPLPKIGSIEDFITKILQVVVEVGLPVVAVAIVYVGFLFVKARGNEQELVTAKKAFLWTVIGASIVLGAFVIQQAIKATVEGLK